MRNKDITNQSRQHDTGKEFKVAPDQIDESQLFCDGGRRFQRKNRAGALLKFEEISGFEIKSMLKYYACIQEILQLRRFYFEQEVDKYRN